MGTLCRPLLIYTPCRQLIAMFNDTNLQTIPHVWFMYEINEAIFPQRKPTWYSPFNYDVFVSLAPSTRLFELQPDPFLTQSSPVPRSGTPPSQSSHVAPEKATSSSPRSLLISLTTSSIVIQSSNQTKSGIHMRGMRKNTGQQQHWCC